MSPVMAADSYKWILLPEEYSTSGRWQAFPTLHSSMRQTVLCTLQSAIPGWCRLSTGAAGLARNSRQDGELRRPRELRGTTCKSLRLRTEGRLVSRTPSIREEMLRCREEDGNESGLTGGASPAKRLGMRPLLSSLRGGVIGSGSAMA